MASRLPEFQFRALPQQGPWPTADPFLFCVHHLDRYPQGNEQLGPRASLQGRDLGMDFSNKDGWSMYHGEVVPGFPRHPHRGFETITVVRQGLVDHADSLGAAARYGAGDVQWMTAGDGINHAEMFPLLRNDEANPTELFQIWLNLPASKKRVAPHFTMFWASSVPELSEGGAHLRLIAGEHRGAQPPSPPPDSYASMSGSEVAIWSLVLEQGTEFTLPPVSSGVTRCLYHVGGAPSRLCGQTLPVRHFVEMSDGRSLQLSAAEGRCDLLLLQGKPIGEPVAWHGPFVMNTHAELVQAFADYQHTGFGGWPWPGAAPHHGPDSARFARHADGREESP